VGNQKFLFFLAIGWLALITILLCIPGTSLPKVGWSDKMLLDKWVHIFLFLVLVWLWCTTNKKVDAFKVKRNFITITILSIVYGIIMEIIQHFFIPFRSSDVGDIIADSIGSIGGYFISIRRFLKNI
jgi:VanZ family protein